jgi:hypothetical protein
VAAGVAASAKIAGWASSIENIVAIDLINEWDINQCSTWGLSGAPLAQAQSDLSSLVLACRATCPTKPFTISTSAPAYGRLSPVYALPNGAALDFLDVHYYFYSNNGPPGIQQLTFQPALVETQLTALAEFVPGYPGIFILGETGMPDAPQHVANGQGFQRQWAAKVPTLTNATNCLGACWWPLTDTVGTYQSGANTGNWGMFPQNIGDAPSPRTQITVPFGQWPGRLG